MSDLQRLTHSRLSSYRACPRRHYLSYELGLRKEETTLALRAGSAFHAAIEAQANGEDVAAAMEAVIDDPYDLALVAAMFFTHRDRWASQQLEVVAAELEFSIKLRNPSTGSTSRTWKLNGVIDKIVKLPDGRLAVMEYKTTTRDFAPDAEYWRGLHLDQQLSIYVIAARRLGYDVSTTLYDVTRRPTLRPKMATPVAERKYTKKQTKLKDGTVRPAGSLHANQRAEDETPEEFAHRVSETMLLDPERHFARIEIARLDDDLLECERELWIQQKTIRSSQLDGGWFRNPQACYTPFTCDFASICQYRDLEQTTPEGFVRLEDPHAELKGDATVGG